MKSKSYIKSISGVLLIMLIGKLIALAANQVYLSYLDPSSEQLNIYSWAINIPNYIFQSIGTALASVVIPIFAALLVQKKEEQANRFASNVICVVTLITAVLVAVGLGLSSVLPNLTNYTDKSYTSFALRVMMPVMFFYGLCYIYQGILQSHEKYASAALVNLPSGIMIILYTIFLSRKFGVTGLIIVTALGLLMQWLILIIPAKRSGFRFRPVIDFKDQDLRQAGKMTLPIILGASAYQFNMFFNNTMMTNVSPSSVSLFNFVQNLILSSVMTIVLAITSVMYPTLTKHVAENDMDGYKNVLSNTLGGTIFFLLPLSVGIILMRVPFLSLLSQHGAVTAEHIQIEASFLFMYCLCIVFLGIKEIADRAFYSLKITRISAITGVAIMAVNVALGFVLSKYTSLKETGIPLAYSIATIAGTLFLVIMLRKQIGRLGGKLAETIIKSAIGTVLMGAGVWVCYHYMKNMTFGGETLSRLVRLIVPVIAGVLIYFVVSLLMKNPPLVKTMNKRKQSV